MEAGRVVSRPDGSSLRTENQSKKANRKIGLSA